MGLKSGGICDVGVDFPPIEVIKSFGDVMIVHEDFTAHSFGSQNQFSKQSDEYLIHLKIFSSCSPHWGQP